MPNGHALELSTLPTNHPRVEWEYFIVSTILRLSLDPTTLPSGTMERTVAVDWLAQPGGGTPQTVTRVIGWNNLPDRRDKCTLWPFTFNANDITEAAAIGVMALLIHDLEGAEIQRVLQIGSGGDYLLIVGSEQIQVECSGIRSDPNGSASRSRLAQKCQQVLSNSRSGFASVTTFSHGPGEDVHSYLHFVSAAPKPRKGRGKKRRRK
jgi:hypothetical protein